MSFFGVGTNPFSTPIGQKIEQATSEVLQSEDWSLNMEICDMIGQFEEGPKDAMKAIKKRLTMQPKNYTMIMYTLTVLETCVKNCGRRMHILVCNKDFVQELVKLIGPKNDPPPVVQEKVLSLIKSWAETFRHQPELSGVSQVYADLKHKGVIFPMMDPENTAPIITPQRTVNPVPPVHPAPVPSNRRVVMPEVPAPQITPENKAKLQSELELVESNAKILLEMLNEAKPEVGHNEDVQLMQDLYSTCRAMQDRVVDLVGRIDDDFLTELLRVNDELNGVFTRYDEFMKSIGPPPKPPADIQPPPQDPQPTDAQLIDLGDEVPHQQMAVLGISKGDEVDFDSFAQSRTSDNVLKPAIDITSEKESDEMPVPVEDATWKQRPSDFDEMESWLQQEKNAEMAANGKEGDRISSSEFDRFLAERAAAAETLPQVQGSNPVRSRNLSKDDQNDKSQFSL